MDWERFWLIASGGWQEEIRTFAIENIFESNNCKLMTRERNFAKVGLTPIIDSIKDSFSSPKKFDYKKELAKSLSKKYLSRERTDLIING